MFKQKLPSAAVQSMWILTMVATICVVAPAQKSTSVMGAPLKGVDVKLGKNPGGQAAARATTNAKGEFNFGIQPAGKYDLIVSHPANSAATQTAEADQRASNLNLSKSNINRIAIAIDGVKGGPLKKDLEFKVKQPDSAQRVGKPQYQDITVTIETDGATEVKGTITARAVNNAAAK
jgi:hypothetical protein